jgi:Concanavalin A-like lectin/glucanases superfamily/Domain of unknown function (DUF2341)/Bacterial Ig-like domain
VNPSVTLTNSIEYYVLVDATAIDDLAGNSYAGISSTTAWSFTTAATNLDPWYNSSWTKRVKLVFDNSTRAENLTNFPVLVVLNSGNIDYSQIQDDGDDLRFTEADGTTVLDYEIEKWDEAGNSYVWVEIPQIDASSSTDYVYMYYNNAGASTGATGTATWNSNFLAVNHLKEDPAGSAPQFQDSTANNKDGTAAGSMSSGNSVTGQIGNALDFNGVAGTGNYVDLGSNFPDNGTVTSLPNGTVELWFNTDSVASFTGDRYLFSRVQSGSFDGEWRLYLDTTTAEIGKIVYRIECTVGTTQNNIVRSDAAVTAAGGWYHVVAVWDDDTANSMKLYVNGVLQASPLSPVCGMEMDGPDSVKFAVNNALATGYYDGQIDEFRVSTAVYTDAMASASYAAQNNNLITYNSPETYSAGSLTSTNVQPASLAIDAVGNVTVSFTTTNTIPADGKIVVTFPTSLGSGFTFNS